MECMVIIQVVMSIMKYWGGNDGLIAHFKGVRRYRKSPEMVRRDPEQYVFKVKYFFGQIRVAYFVEGQQTWHNLMWIGKS